MDIQHKFKKIKTALSSAVQFLWHTLTDTYRSFNRSLAGEATAGLAYYAFFSIFPLILILVAAASSWLTEDQAQQHVIEYVTSIFPISPDLVGIMINTLVTRRFSTTLISTIGLLWSSSGYFNALVRHVNRAWPDVRPAHFVRTRLQSLMIVLGLGVLFVLSLMVTSGVELLDALDLPFSEELIHGTFLSSFLSNILPLLVRLGLLWMLYDLVPRRSVHHKSAVISAVTVTLGWRLITILLTWYLGAGFGRYNVVYGSLGTTIASLMWLYFSNYILLMGAHLTSVLDAALTRPAAAAQQEPQPQSLPAASPIPTSPLRQK